MDNNQRTQDKLDKIAWDITEIKVTLAEQHVTLKEHTSRSTKLEDIVIPIQRKFAMLEGALKLIGVLSLILGVIEAARMFIK